MAKNQRASTSRVRAKLQPKINSEDRNDSEKENVICEENQNTDNVKEKSYENMEEDLKESL